MNYPLLLNMKKGFSPFGGLTVSALVKGLLPREGMKETIFLVWTVGDCDGASAQRVVRKHNLTLGTEYSLFHL